MGPVVRVSGERGRVQGKLHKSHDKQHACVLMLNTSKHMRVTRVEWRQTCCRSMNDCGLSDTKLLLSDLLRTVKDKTQRMSKTLRQVSESSEDIPQRWGGGWGGRYPAEAVTSARSGNCCRSSG